MKVEDEEEGAFKTRLVSESLLWYQESFWSRQKLILPNGSSQGLTAPTATKIFSIKQKYFPTKYFHVWHSINDSRLARTLWEIFEVLGSC